MKYEKLGNLINEVSSRNRSNIDYKVYSVTNSEGFILSTDYFSKEVFSKDISNYKIVSKYQFAYNPSRINVGSIDFFKENSKALISPLYVVFECRENLFPDFLKRFLKSPLGNARIRAKTVGSVRDTLSFTNLKEIKIPLPTMPEQIRIANILSKAEELISERKQSIKLLDDSLKSVFLDMFGDPVKNEKGWEVKKLSNVCGFITKGTTPKRQDILKSPQKDSIPLIKVYNIVDNGNINFHINPTYISKNTHLTFLKRSIVLPNDVLMNIVGPPLGKIGLVPNMYPEWNVNQAIAIFRTESNLNHFYLLNVLRNENFIIRIIKMAVGVRQLNLSLDQCREIIIPVPPIELQNKFAQIVEKTEQIKADYKQSLQEFENLYGSLSKNAFGR